MRPVCAASDLASPPFASPRFAGIKAVWEHPANANHREGVHGSDRCSDRGRGRDAE